MDLEEKAIHLCSKVIELVGMAKGKKAYDLAYNQLKSGAAWKKMQRIIKAQRWKKSSYPIRRSPIMTIQKRH
jgi:thymidine phosphorylase